MPGLTPRHLDPTALFAPLDEFARLGLAVSGGADSLALLEQVIGLVRRCGWQVVNVDAVVVAERPRLKPHITAMRAAIAARLGVEPDQVGVKATTNEGLGPTGREEGIACHAVALLQKP